MVRLRFAAFVALTASLALLGCDKKPQQPRQEPPAETGAEQTAPDAEPADADQADAEQADAGQADDEQAGADSSDAGTAQECPKPRDYQGMCTQVVTWAKDPESGQCCQYGSPCEAPENWQTFTDESACAQVGGQTAN